MLDRMLDAFDMCVCPGSYNNVQWTKKKQYLLYYNNSNS